MAENDLIERIAQHLTENAGLTEKDEMADIVLGVYLRNESQINIVREAFEIMLRKTDVNDLCKRYGMSKSAFYNQFKILGINPSDYRNERTVRTEISKAEKMAGDNADKKSLAEQIRNMSRNSIISDSIKKAAIDFIRNSLEENLSISGGLRKLSNADSVVRYWTHNEKRNANAKKAFEVMLMSFGGSVVNMAQYYEVDEQTFNQYLVELGVNTEEVKTKPSNGKREIIVEYGNSGRQKFDINKMHNRKKAK